MWYVWLTGSCRNPSYIYTNRPLSHAFNIADISGLVLEKIQTTDCIVNSSYLVSRLKPFLTSVMRLSFVVSINISMLVVLRIVFFSMITRPHDFNRTTRLASRFHRFTVELACYPMFYSDRYFTHTSKNLKVYLSCFSATY